MSARPIPEWLAAIGVGDTVLIDSRVMTTGKVTHATPTQIHVGRTKFSRCDGFRMGERSAWEVTPRLIEHTPINGARYTRQRDAARRAMFLHRISAVALHWAKQPEGGPTADEMNQIIDLLGTP